MTDRLDVWVVEDDRLFREAVEEYLCQQPGLACGLAAGSCEEVLDALKRGGGPDVVLLDLGLPGMSGFEGIGRIRSLSDTTSVLILTVREDEDAIFEALCLGASGYLLKPATGDRIIDAIETVSSGGAPMNAFVARKVLALFDRYVRRSADYGLTRREREVLRLLVEEKTQREIAEALFLSPHTVDTHLRNVYAKLHVHSRTGAVVKALRERLI